ncbi:hypothetical protein CI102_3243 [Trichoderma harzianum]|nr:hypothetical protein CI102_3243 [Trichoderma harzianum]
MKHQFLLNPIGEQLKQVSRFHLFSLAEQLTDLLGPAPGPGALLASKAGTAISIVQLFFFSSLFFFLRSSPSILALGSDLDYNSRRQRLTAVRPKSYGNISNVQDVGTRLKG